MSFLSIVKKQRADFTKGVDLTHKGNGSFLYLSLENVDEFHTHLLSKGIQLLTSPRLHPAWSRRYRLVIFKRK